MSDFFNQDNAYNRVMTKVFDLALLNIFWALCCLPVITIGASTSALYSMTLKMVKDEEGAIAQSFFRTFRQNFHKSIPYTLIFLAVSVILFLDFHILGSSADGKDSVLYGCCIVLLIFAVAIFGYVFPLFSKFDNKVGRTFNNAWRLAATHLPVTLLIVAVNTAPFLWILFSPETFSNVFYIWLILGTSASVYLESYFLRKIFDRLIKEQTPGPSEDKK